jgi:hypothetical protein
LKALDDTLMGEMTGQAGLTIDVETKWTLGEFMYKDGGSVVIQNINLGGSTNAADNVASANGGYLDNIRLTIDVAGAGNGTTLGDNYLAFGMSNLISLAGIHAYAGNTDAGILALAGAVDPRGPVDVSRLDAAGNALKVDRAKFFGNGDLVIKSTFTDAWQKGGGFAAYANGTGQANWADASTAAPGATSLKTLTYTGAQEIASRAVDFNFGFEVLGLTSSAYNAGDAAGGIATNQASTRGMGTVINKQDLVNGYDPDTTTTTLISDLTINGYFGPSDFIIRNRGNGFGANANGYNYGDAVSKIETNRYIRITDLDVYIDIAGVQIKDLKIHNDRGDKSGLFMETDANDPLNLATLSGTSSFGFAHASRDIYAVKDDVLDLGRAVALTGGPAGFGAALAAAAPNLTTTAVRANYYTDGIVLHNKFKGDIDIPHLSFGNDGRSIGEIYLTDYTNETKLTISAH